jgi:hypothetical protein
VKKSILLVIILLITNCAISSETGNAVSPTSKPKFGIVLDSISSAIVLGQNNYGIKGLTLRFLDEKLKGFEIPVTLHFAHEDIGMLDAYSNTKNGALSIGSGIGLVIPLIINENFRFFTVPEIAGSYTFRWYVPQDINVGQVLVSWYLALSHKFELEFPVGQLFSLHKDQICIGVGLKFIATFGQKLTFENENIREGVSTLETSMYGIPLDTISIRAYF